VFNRVFRAIKNSIIVTRRYYKFLVFRNLQFCKNGAYFYALILLKLVNNIYMSLR
ncbi:hypothetical protein J3E73DRAFT_183961, partial [Bipolaris maydis]